MKIAYLTDRSSFFKTILLLVGLLNLINTRLAAGEGITTSTNLGTWVGSSLVMASPENSIFQYQTDSIIYTPPGGFASVTTQAYLWIPPSIKKIRGLLIINQNVPEQRLVANAEIRKACGDVDMAILFACPRFYMPDTYKLPLAQKGPLNVEVLQKVVDALAEESGHPEIRTAPWLPMGESMALQIPCVLTSFVPDRCIAGVLLKDIPIDRTTSPNVPILATKGTGVEWNQEQYDVFTEWQNGAVVAKKQVVDKRTATPTWPGSLLIEAGSSHFSITDKMTSIVAHYIKASALARLSLNGSDALRPVDLDNGYVVGLPGPEDAGLPPKSYKECSVSEKNLPWYFTKELAQEAYDLANVNWNAKSAMVNVVSADGTPAVLNHRGITTLTVVYEEDGISFRLKAGFYDKLPDNFVHHGGETITHPAEQPITEWVCGPFKPLGGDRFQVYVDRSYRATNYYARSFYPGNSDYRLTTNPIGLALNPCKSGERQNITFPPIPDQKMPVNSITLKATSSSGLPVRYFVKSGPAVIVNNNQLVFQDVPHYSNKAMKIKVVAWQWGKYPDIQAATPVEQTFYLTLRSTTTKSVAKDGPRRGNK
ncbi:MAG: hypothetical protein ACOYOT_09580 [Bacteroidales bacterium]